MAFRMYSQRRSIRWFRIPRIIPRAIRRAQNVRFALFCLSSMMCAMLWDTVPAVYQDVRLFEEALPQHTNRPSDVQTFIWFEGMLTGHGLNNVLQEALLMSYVAYDSGRSFVFQDYIWSKLPTTYVLGTEPLAIRPSRIPLNAFISGPTAGGPFPNNASRSVTLDYFRFVCPKHRQTRISSDDSPTDQDGEEVLKWWRQTLLDHASDPCLVVTASKKKVFDWDLIGSTRALSLYATLRSSPILTSFTWSSIVQSGVLRNLHILGSSRVSDKTNIRVPGLIAVHLRRGDYTRHCRRLAKQRAEYVGMNNAPELLDRLDVDAWMEANDHADPEPYYLERCLPSEEQLRKRLNDIRAVNPNLKRVFVLSNASRSWLSSLSSKLLDDGWSDVKSTLDLRLDSEQSHVGMAVDMAIAETAEVFVGNGFSSLSANIVMLRMGKGLSPASNRLL